VKTKLFLLIASTLVSWLFAEAVLVFVPELAPSPRTFHAGPGARPNPNFAADPEIGWRMKPHHTFASKAEEFATTYSANANGFRDDKDYNTDARRPRIVIVGDSFTFGLGVSREESYPGIMQNSLPEFEVMNLGMPGFGLDQMWQTLRRVGLERRPALVVVGFVLDDFGRSLSGYRADMGFAKPWFKLVDGRPAPASDSDAPGMPFDLIERHSRIYTGIVRALRLAGRYYPIGTWWNLNGAILREMSDDCARAGVPLLFVHLPSRQRTAVPVLGQSLHARGAHYLDLAGEKFPAGASVVYPVDGHLNAKGHEIVAQEILQWIERNPLRQTAE
jgi:hypothetical protein